MIHSNVNFDLYFIRHGESESNVTPGIAAGKNFDAPMTKRGHEQAFALGRRLRKEGVKFDRVYSSSLIRAIETTEEMLRGMERTDIAFDRVDHIIEQQIPAWRGALAADVWTPELRFLSAEKGKWFQPADGESERAVERRAGNWIEDEILFNPEWQNRSGTQTIAVITHGVTLRTIFHYITGFDTNFIRRTEVYNCSISRFKFGHSGWSIVTMNDACHTVEVGDIRREGIVQGGTVVP